MTEGRESLLPCCCLRGAQTFEEEHEGWCPVVAGDFDGLPVVTVAANGDQAIVEAGNG